MSKKIKIAWLCPYPLNYLREIPVRHRVKHTHPSTWITNLASALKSYYADSIELHLITQSTHVQKSFQIEQDGIQFHVLRSGSTIPFTMRGVPGFFPIDIYTFFYFNRLVLQRRLNSIKPDLIHAHGTEGPNGLTAVSSGIPCVISVQGIVHELTKGNNSLVAKVNRAAERHTILRGKNFVAKTNFSRAFIAGINPDANIYDIENPVHEAYFEVNRQESEIKSVLFIGSLLKQKGIEELLEAIAEIKNVQLWVVGIGSNDYELYLQQKAHTLGIGDRVIWHGAKTPWEIARLMEYASLLALPSYMENSPNVVSEAMVAGLPVVASKVGGIPSMIKDGITGILCEPKDNKSLLQAISQILRDPLQSAEISFRAQEEAKRRFSPKLAAEKIFSMYLDCLGRNYAAL